MEESGRRMAAKLITQDEAGITTQPVFSPRRRLRCSPRGRQNFSVLLSVVRLNAPKSIASIAMVMAMSAEAASAVVNCSLLPRPVAINGLPLVRRTKARHLAGPRGNASMVNCLYSIVPRPPGELIPSEVEDQAMAVSKTLR